MKLLKSYNNHLFYLSILTILLIAMLLIVVYPAFTKINKIRKEINLEREILENKLSLGINIKKINEELLSAEKYQNEFDSVFIKTGQEIELINYIENIAKKYNLEINLKPDFNLPKSNNNITKLPININLIGEFSNIYSFIKELDGAPFYLITEQTTITKSKEDKISLNIVCHAFIKK